MKVSDKPQALAAFVELLTTTFNSLHGRKAENLLHRLAKEIAREESWKAGKSGVPLADFIVTRLAVPRALTTKADFLRLSGCYQRGHLGNQTPPACSDEKMKPKKTNQKQFNQYLLENLDILQMLEAQLKAEGKWLPDIGIENVTKNSAALFRAWKGLPKATG